MTRRYPRRIVTCAAALLVLIADCRPGRSRGDQRAAQRRRDAARPAQGPALGGEPRARREPVRGRRYHRPVSRSRRTSPSSSPRRRSTGARSRHAPRPRRTSSRRPRAPARRRRSSARGTAVVDAIGLPFNAKLWIYNGTGTDAARKILLFAHVTDPGVEVNLPLGGTLKRTSGQYGFKLDLPIPDIEVVSGQFAAIKSFNVVVGKRTRKGGKKVSFIDAPTSCPSGGWPFSMAVTFKDGGTASDRRAINCTLMAT